MTRRSLTVRQGPPVIQRRRRSGANLILQLQRVRSYLGAVLGVNGTRGHSEGPKVDYLWTNWKAPGSVTSQGGRFKLTIQRPAVT